MIYIAISIVCICITIMRLQNQSYAFRREERAQVNAVALSAELTQGLKDLADYKTKVDSLALRVGFR